MPSAFDIPEVDLRPRTKPKSIPDPSDILNLAEVLWRDPTVSLPLTHEKLENGNPQILKHPNIPKPLHGLAPRTILGQAWWNTVREEAYTRKDYHCHACGIHKSKAAFHKWLEAHEFYSIDYAKGQVEMVEIVALCHACHNYIHDGRMQMMAIKDEFPLWKYINILKRGNTIIQNQWKEPFIETDFGINSTIGIAHWSDWHLLLNGEKHYSPYENEYEWAAHYNNL